MQSRYALSGGRVRVGLRILKGETVRDGYPQLGAAGPLGGLATRQVAAPSWQCGALACLRAPADDGAREADATRSLTELAGGAECRLPLRRARASTVTGRQAWSPGRGKWAYSRGMPEWIGSAATVAATLVALAALIVSIGASRRVARKRELELLLERIDQEAAKREADTRALTERIDREAAKREEAIRDVLDRSDRKFEALQRRSDELYRQSAEITSRVAHTEAVLEAAPEADTATGQSDAVAAQDVLGDRPSE